GIGSPARGAAREDQDDVLAQTGDLRFDQGFGAIADADGDDDSADAEDNAEHGQNAAHFIALQCATGNFKNGEDSHGASWTERCSSRMRRISSVALKRSATKVSPTTRPSRITMFRRV